MYVFMCIVRSCEVVVLWLDSNQISDGGNATRCQGELVNRLLRVWMFGCGRMVYGVWVRKCVGVHMYITHNTRTHTDIYTYTRIQDTHRYILSTTYHVYVCKLIHP